MPEKPHNFWQELKRRKVVRVITVYAAAAFVVIELTNNITEPLHLPDWVPTLVIFLLAIGFFISIVMSWVYDITPEGIQKTRPASVTKPVKKEKGSLGWKISTYVSLLVVMAFIIFYIVSSAKKSSEISRLEKSIAVLPFENLSFDKEYAYMGDAITDEIILELQKISAFDRVISRSSTMQFKENRPTMPEIAEKLGVNYIIEGSIQRHEDRVSIRVQVIRARKEDHIWADKYEGRWEDILSIQDEIAMKVAGELKAILTSNEIEKIEQKPTGNSEAYNLYLKGRHSIFPHTESGYLEGIRYFEQAISMDPDYAMAYVWMAFSYKELSRAFRYAPEQGYLKGKEAAEKAIGIDNSIGDAYAILASIWFLADWNMTEPEAEFKKAIELSPSSVDVYILYAQYLTWTDRIDEAILTYKRALEIDPFNVWTNQWLGGTYFYGNRYEESIQQLKGMLEFAREFSNWGHTYIADNYIMMGRYEEAISHADQINTEGSNILLAALGTIYAYSGMEERAREILNQLLAMSADDIIDPTLIAMIYAGLGETEQVFECLNRAFEERSGLMVYLKLYSRTFFRELRSDPRLIELLEKMGFDTD